jgi:hypothetical protein
MTDKQDAPSEACSLPDWQMVEVAGADAAAFLQAQTMNDVRPLAPGNWQWNGWLNPKGRLIALFALAALEAQRYWLVVPDFPASELAARMQRFVFRSKVKLGARADLQAFGAFAAPSQARGAMLHREGGDAGAIEFDLGGEGGARALRIAPVPATLIGVADLEGSLRADADAQCVWRWTAFDLAHGLPRLSIDQSEQWTPQMLSLDRLGAYSLKKGCYPGQEIVARTHFLGQAKRALARVAGEGLATGAEIAAEGRALGVVVASAAGEALAVLAVDRPEGEWTCGGVACRELPLLGGLAR